MYFDECVHIEEDDQCFTCEYYRKGVSCPLLEALALGVVDLHGDVRVRNCGFYRKFERRLRVVEDASASENAPETPDAPPDVKNAT
ncbi:MAG: hypothetical protein IPK79_04995 [Vampirovibrionales bacterium]|nr:hypothetical protein [Vampirovibrionales bacterium]